MLVYSRQRTNMGTYKKTNNKERTDGPAETWAKDKDRQFLEDEIQMANKHMKSCSMSLVIREAQMKAMRNHFPPTRA